MKSSTLFHPSELDVQIKLIIDSLLLGKLSVGALDKNCVEYLFLFRAELIKRMQTQLEIITPHKKKF